MRLHENLRHQAKMTEEAPAYPGASPEILRAAADEIERLEREIERCDDACFKRDVEIANLRREMNGWQARAQVSEALLTDLEKRS